MNVFGTVEYWFSAIKITAIVLFILLAGYVLWRTAPLGAAAPAAIGFQQLHCPRRLSAPRLWGM